MNVSQQALQLPKIPIKLPIERLIKTFSNINPKMKVPTPQRRGGNTRERKRLTQRNQ
jgi:hypothetical protein